MVLSPKNRDSVASVGDVISDSNTSLSEMFRHADELAHVESLLVRHTSTGLSEQFQVAAMRQDRLVLLTSTASWATCLRMQADNFIQFLQVSGYQNLRYIDIRVAPLNREAVEKPRRRNLSPAAELALTLMSHLATKSDNH